MPVWAPGRVALSETNMNASAPRAPGCRASVPWYCSFARLSPPLSADNEHFWPEDLCNSQRCTNPCAHPLLFHRYGCSTPTATPATSSCATRATAATWTPVGCGLAGCLAAWRRRTSWCLSTMAFVCPRPWSRPTLSGCTGPRPCCRLSRRSWTTSRPWMQLRTWRCCARSCPCSGHSA